MVRTPTFDKNGIKKGAWSPEEDAKLIAYISHYGHWNWRELPKFAGLKRCGKSCRLRWMNYLRPDLKHGNYTVEEDQLIIQLHQQHGNKWAEMASKLPGRSDNDIKNHWHTHLKKLAGFKKPATNKVSKIHKPILNDQIGASHIEILESCPVTSSAANYVSTSSDVGTSISSNMDDWGLDEMMNSDDLFAEMSSLLSPINQHDEGKFGVQLESPVNAMLYDYGAVDQDDLWSEALLVSDKYDEVLFSPSLNYYQDNDFNLFFHETM